MYEQEISKLSNGQYSITLPPTWVDKYYSEQDKLISLKEYKNNLVLYLNQNYSQNSVAYINFNSISLKLFNKLVISHYLKNYPKIIIKGKDLDSRFEYIKTYVKKLPGMQIISITSNSIELKNDTNLKGIDIINLISNIENCITSMYKQLQNTDPKKTYFQIQELDTSINELYLLIKKCLNYSTQEEIDIEIVSKSLTFSKIIAAYEKIGDIIKRISRYYKTHIDNPEEIVPLVNSTIEQIMLYHEQIIIFKNKCNNKYEFLNRLQDSKNSILREIDERSNLRDINYTLELVISQLAKDILGEYEKIIETIIDSCE